MTSNLYYQKRFVDFLESLLTDRMHKRGFITVMDNVSDFKRTLKYEIVKDITTVEETNVKVVRLNIEWFIRFEKADLTFIESIKRRVIESINIKPFDEEMVEFVVVTGSGL